jgi:hypothetical protein
MTSCSKTLFQPVCPKRLFLEQSPAQKSAQKALLKDKGFEQP